MPGLGGPGSIAGYDYQLWFIAYYLSKALNGNNIVVHPEATIITIPSADSESESIVPNEEINFIDDVIVYTDKIPSVYNIKYIASNDSNWTFNKLKKEGVIEDIYNQTIKFTGLDIYFVSQSRCDLLGETFKRIRNLNTDKAIRHELTKRQYEDWTKLKDYFNISLRDLLKVIHHIRYIKGFSKEEYEEIIKEKLSDKFTNSSNIGIVLKELALQACIDKSKVNTNDILDFLDKRDIKRKSGFNFSELINDTVKISASLNNWENTFGKLNSSHILRSEVSRIIDWVKSPIASDKRPILMLTGKAGSGKSVIMRDVLEELRKQNFLNLGLKLDLYDVENFQELNSRLNISEDFEKLINTLSEQRNLIILFDQMDSLSLSMSKNRASINFFYDLINRISLCKNVRIILSCRLFDLHYDTTLNIYEKETSIEIKDLMPEEVAAVLIFLKLEFKNLPDKLAKLLLNPQNLNIFCSIYEVGISLTGIKTIQDLFNILWRNKIISVKGEYPDIENLVSAIVDDMSGNQKLNVNSFQYEDIYPAELLYLLSEGILIRDKNSIQFFHQTFYEYTFARFFVSKRNDIFLFVSKGHQGLFIRNSIIQLLNYLKSVDIVTYLSAITRLLKEKKIRFHIILLIFNHLATSDNPIEEEWTIVNKYVLSNIKLRPFFIEAVNNIFWFHKLLINNKLTKWHKSKDSQLILGCESMMYKLIEMEPVPVLNYILHTNNLEKHNNFIVNILYSLKNWDNSESYQLFDKNKKYFSDHDSTFLEEILKKAYAYHSVKVYSFLDQFLFDKIDKFVNHDILHRGDLLDHSIEQLLQYIYSKDQEGFYKLVIPHIKKLVYSTIMELKSKHIAVDGSFYHFEQFESLYSHHRILSKVIEYSEYLALNNPEKFAKLVLPLIEETSLTLLKIPISGLIKCAPLDTSSAFRILSNYNFLKDYDLDLGMSYKVYELLRLYFSSFSIEQKSKIYDILVIIDNEKITKDNKQYKSSDVYQLLNAIPEIERKQFNLIQRRYLELQRKFGTIENYKITESRFSGVGGPIPSKAYEKMSLDEWLTSLKKYDNKTGWDKGYHNKRGFNFGGLIEHSRMFQTVVKNNPDNYFLFLNKIIYEEIDSQYISEGIRGLIEGNYNPGKIGDLINQIIKLPFEKKIRRILISAIEYIDGNISLEKDLLEILIQYCLSDPDPEKEVLVEGEENKKRNYNGDSLTEGINSIRGSAAFALVKLKNAHSNKEAIFTTLEKLADDESIAVRCAAIANLHILIKLDENRIFKIYKLFNRYHQPEIYSYSISVLGYFCKKKYSKIKIDLINSSLINEGKQSERVLHYVGIIIAYLYFQKVKDHKELFESIFIRSDEIKAGVLKHAIDNLTNAKRSIRAKAAQLFVRMLKYDSQSINNEYFHCFSDSSPEDFQVIYPLLITYTQNRSLKRRDTYNLYKYLLKCVNQYPTECIDLLSNIFKNMGDDPREYTWTNEPIRLLVGSYNRLKKYNMKNTYTEKAMDIFDEFLHKSNFRYTLFSVLSETDYS